MRPVTSEMRALVSKRSQVTTSSRCLVYFNESCFPPCRMSPGNVGSAMICGVYSSCSSL